MTYRALPINGMGPKI